MGKLRLRAPQVFLGTEAWAPPPRQAEPADSSPLGACPTLLPRCHDNRLIIPHRPSGRVDTASGVSQLRLPGAQDWTVLAWAGSFALLQHRPRACRALSPLSPRCWGSGPQSCPMPCGLSGVLPSSGRPGVSPSPLAPEFPLRAGRGEWGGRWFPLPAQGSASEGRRRTQRGQRHRRGRVRQALGQGWPYPESPTKAGPGGCVHTSGLRPRPVPPSPQPLLTQLLLALRKGQARGAVTGHHCSSNSISHEGLR